MEINYKDLNDGDIVYGCAFNIDFDRNTWRDRKVIHNICKPIKGIILDEIFYILKKNGKPRESGEVRTMSRHFANTYEESVEIYNHLIADKQDKLRKIANDLEKEIISLPF